MFGGFNGSLYDWISSQDEHSSLPELIRECRDTLTQVNNILIMMNNKDYQSMIWFYLKTKRFNPKVFISYEYSYYIIFK